MGLRWSEVQILSPRPQKRGRKNAQETASYLVLFVLSLLSTLSKLLKNATAFCFQSTKARAHHAKNRPQKTLDLLVYRMTRVMCVRTETRSKEIYTMSGVGGAGALQYNRLLTYPEFTLEP